MVYVGGLVAAIIVNVFIAATMLFVSKPLDPDSVSMKFKQFLDLYKLKPQVYRLSIGYAMRKHDKENDDPDLKVYKEIEDYGYTEYIAKIRFTSSLQYLKYYLWLLNKNKSEADQKSNEMYRNLLKACENDIDEIRKKAEESIRNAERINNEIKLRLEKSEKKIEEYK